MTRSETSEAPSLHPSLKALSDPDHEVVNSWSHSDVNSNTDELAITSTYCPGTKCNADKVVPLVQKVNTNG